MRTQLSWFIWSDTFKPWPTELWDIKWVLIKATKFVVICYAALENQYSI